MITLSNAVVYHIITYFILGQITQFKKKKKEILATILGTTSQIDISEDGQITKENNVCTVAEYMFVRDTLTFLVCSEGTEYLFMA